LLKNQSSDQQISSNMQNSNFGQKVSCQKYKLWSKKIKLFITIWWSKIQVVIKNPNVD